MVIGCCDFPGCRREVIFDAGPGELFVVRNVANLGAGVSNPDSGTPRRLCGAGICRQRVAREAHRGARPWPNAAASAPSSTRQAPLSPGDFQFGKMDGDVRQARRSGRAARGTRACRISRSGSRRAAVFRSLEKPDDISVRAGGRSNAARYKLHGAYFGVSEGSLFVLDRNAKEFIGVARDARQRVANRE